ncbi:MAG: hypothetical protein CML45_07060 [Rhodobacteraceae bacterium]|nr:hypothetical protein [Paracoccaceae bacterium]
MKDWEEIKEIEKKKKTNNKGYLLDNIPKALPALIRAEKLQKKAAEVKFDWVETREVLDKINEESSELINSIDKLNQGEIEEELGDILFTIVNLSRKLKVDPEKALNRTNEKFRYRLNGIEDELIKLGKSFKEIDPDLLETLWEAQKN